MKGLRIINRRSPITMLTINILKQSYGTIIKRNMSLLANKNTQILVSNLKLAKLQQNHLNTFKGQKRWLSDENLSNMDEYEAEIYHQLLKAFDPSDLEVRDVSGGCGSMFAIRIHSPKFQGLSMIKQHRLVNEALKDEIAKWHGLQLRTKASD